MPTDTTQPSGGVAPGSYDSTNITYQDLAGKIKEGACVLFLGPGALIAKDKEGQWRPLIEICARFLAEKYKLKLSADETYSLAYVTSVLRLNRSSTENVLQDDVARFYKAMEANSELHPLIDQLAELPFRIIINTTPDAFVAAAFDARALPYYPDLYNFLKPSSSFNFDFTKDRRTVIYNLFGRYDQPESLILTHKHQLAYIKKIVSETLNDRIPDALINAFRSYQYHLFLGFDFEDWSLRLLVDTLYKNVRDTVQAYAYPDKNTRKAGADTKVFFHGEFGMKFPTDDIEVFVEKVHKEYVALNNSATTTTNETPAAQILILHNNQTDNDAYELLIKHLRVVNAQFHTLENATGQGDTQAWIRQMLDKCQVILPLLSADFYNTSQLSDMALLTEIAKRNNPTKGCLVMPILVKPVGLDGPLGALPTIRPTDQQPLMGSGKESTTATEIAEVIKRYVIKNFSKQ